ncbi:hypothetical protein C5C39_06900 [Rathayibacter sp. AY1F3]|uniref:hypothetical protein n=1 Tax=Rathayibacter sp. AY1F3 TaxID=2080558 RepID=UPI000CE763E0|nr:hypothetical protein [Rathayibacter sp. AY1F3]PPG91555.1 hypothetical protein C5C39_06900 [Rathayibacter sp. AY1F3]
MSTTPTKAPHVIFTKAPTRLSLSTFILTVAVTALAFATAGTIFGYFAGIEIHSQARQNVVSDMQVVSKDQAR